MLIWAIELNAKQILHRIILCVTFSTGWLPQGQPAGAASGSLDLAVRSAVWCCHELSTSQFGCTWSPERRYPVGDIPPLKPHQYTQSVKFQTFNSHQVCIYTHTCINTCISGWKYCNMEQVYCLAGEEGNVTLYVANPKSFLRTGPTFDSAPGLSACIPFPLPPASSTWQLDLEG